MLSSGDRADDFKCEETSRESAVFFRQVCFMIVECRVVEGICRVLQCDQVSEIDLTL